MNYIVDKFLTKRKVKELLDLSEHEFRELRDLGIIKSYRFACDLRRRYYKLSDIIRAFESGELSDYLGWRCSYLVPRVRDFESFVMNLNRDVVYSYDR